MENFLKTSFNDLNKKIEVIKQELNTLKMLAELSERIEKLELRFKTKKKRKRKWRPNNIILKTKLDNELEQYMKTDENDYASTKRSPEYSNDTWSWSDLSSF